MNAQSKQTRLSSWRLPPIVEREGTWKFTHKRISFYHDTPAIMTKRDLDVQPLGRP